MRPLSAAAANPLATLPLPGAPGHLALNPDGRHACVTLGMGPPAGRGSALAGLDTATNALTAVVPLEGAVRGLSASADGTRIHVATIAYQTLTKCRGLFTQQSPPATFCVTCPV